MYTDAFLIWFRVRGSWNKITNRFLSQYLNVLYHIDIVYFIKAKCINDEHLKGSQLSLIHGFFSLFLVVIIIIMIELYLEIKEP